MNKNNIGIIGAGHMGCDLAFDIASNGIPVILKDISSDVVSQVEKRLKSTFLQVKQHRKETKIKPFDEIVSLIHCTCNYDKFHELTFLFENANENWEVKKYIYTEINEVCSSDTIIGINTSCISITKLASLLNNPDKVIGTHFMNPVPLKSIVELIIGCKTSENTKNQTMDFLQQINKSSLIVNDFPGFVSNRISHLFMNEAFFVVQDNIADPHTVDEIFKQGYGHKMGPLETADLIGLDVVLDSLLVLYDSYKDTKYRPCPLLVKMVYAGLKGYKSGEGFFKY